MPTGYTAAIKDGITFDQYALSCARAFGALINMRDEPASAEIPERFEPSPYHMDTLEQIQARMNEVEAMTPEQCSAVEESEHKEATARTLKAIEAAKQLRGKYSAMLDQVDQWQPPTDDHAELKRFMRDQITESMKFDCDTSFYKRSMPRRITPEQWKADRIKAMRRDYAYHEKAYIEEVDRIEKRNKWLAALRESLKT